MFRKITVKGQFLAYFGTVLVCWAICHFAGYPLNSFALMALSLVSVPCWILMHLYLAGITPLLGIKWIRVLMVLPIIGPMFSAIPLALPVAFYMSAIASLDKKYPAMQEWNWMLFPLLALIPMYAIGAYQVMAGYREKQQTDESFI